MTLREKMLLACADIHSGNATEGQAIVEAQLKALREHLESDEVVSKASRILTPKSVRRDSMAGLGIYHGTRAALASIFDEEAE